MGVVARGALGWTLLATGLAAVAAAAPKLRLTETTVGPVSIAAGQNGAARTVEAYNAGDGALALSVSSSVAWISPSVGGARNCTSRAGSCLPVQIGFSTASLAPGAHTGTVTVSDPNALDAPQTISVTVQMGGGVPDRLELFVPPNGSAEATFSTNSRLQWNATTQSGGNWLSLAVDGVGTFRFVMPYRVTARHQSGMAEASYSGSIAISGSTLAAENKTVGVTMRVTSQPIAQASPRPLAARIAQNASKQRANIVLANAGLGTLALAGATASGGNWLAAEPVAGYNVVAVTLDTTGLSPGLYQGSVSIASNAANSPLAVPVELEVVAQAAPRAFAQGVVNNATFEAGDTLAQGAIAAVFGEQFTLGEAQQASKLPLETALGGVRVLVNDQPAPVYFLSYGQINFQLPYETPPGEAVVRVERDGQRGNAVTVQIASRAPRLLRLGVEDYGIIVNQDYSIPMPVTPGVASHPARPGDALVIYAIGLGPTTPAAASGAAAPGDPLAQVTPAPRVYFGGAFASLGVPADPLFVGLTPGFVGLYQINVVVPDETPRSDRVRVMLASGEISSNRVYIAVQ